MWLYGCAAHQRPMHTAQFDAITEGTLTKVQGVTSLGAMPAILVSCRRCPARLPAMPMSSGSSCGLVVARIYRRQHVSDASQDRTFHSPLGALVNRHCEHVVQT